MVRFPRTHMKAVRDSSRVSAACRPALFLVLMVAAMGCNGPILLLPGGELKGEARPAPADWSFATGQTVQLETRPNDPYSVNIVCIVLDDRLYIYAGDTETEWVKNIEADPSVRLRVGGVLYDLVARRVTRPAEIARFAEAWTSQSFFYRDPNKLDRVWLYQLVPR